MKIISPPGIEPISLAEAKLHLRIDCADEDTLIGVFISAARQACESRIQRSLITQTLELSLDSFPSAAIELPRGPVQSIVSIQYRNTKENLVQLATGTDFFLDNSRMVCWAVPAYGAEWPETLDVANAVTIQYVVGFGDLASDVPAPLRSWMLLAIGDLYTNRARSAEKPVVPQNFADSLLDPYAIWSM